MDVGEARKMASDAIERLAEELERGESESLQRYLAAMGRFHRYSLRNAMLIAQQRNDATHVCGFGTWKKLGRHVRKGERGIVILAPIVRRGAVPRMARATPGGEHASGTREEDDERAVCFRAAYVFDISQTDGKPLPEFAKVRGDPHEYTERLKVLVARRGIVLTYSDRIAPAHGVCAGDRITLLPDLSPAEEFATLAHELAHSALHSAEEYRSRSKVVRETEAEAVACVVCEAIGLDARGASSDYISLYDGKCETLLESLTRIQSTAAEIIEAVVHDRPVSSLIEPLHAPLTTSTRGASLSIA